MDALADRDYLALAYARALDSPDLSNENGALLVPAGLAPYPSVLHVGGCNDFVAGTEVTPELLADRDAKLRAIIHAETAAIFEAAATGLRLFDATMYSPWAPCSECAKAIIACDITRLVVHGDRMDLTPERWKEDVKAGLAMLAASECVLLTVVRGAIDAEPILVNGRLWSPKTCAFVECEDGMFSSCRSSEKPQEENMPSSP